MKFSISASITYTGWIEVDAEDIKEAKAKGYILHDVGIELVDLKDADCTSEVNFTEAQEIKT